MYTCTYVSNFTFYTLICFLIVYILHLLPPPPTHTYFYTYTYTSLFRPVYIIFAIWSSNLMVFYANFIITIF